ncbi:hypothetical protein ACVJGD_008439 [Bradyrhizobium sp. USDA 10063]
MSQTLNRRPQKSVTVLEHSLEGEVSMRRMTYGFSYNQKKMSILRSERDALASPMFRAPLLTRGGMLVVDCTSHMGDDPSGTDPAMAYSR